MRWARKFLLPALPALGLLWLLSPLGPMPYAWGGPGPHGGYELMEDACATCHGTHTAQSPMLLVASETGNAFCYTCHDGTGAPAAPIVSTHSNIDSTGVEADFTLSCTACHEPHGSSNLFAIREYPVVEAGAPVTVGPVVFTFTSGAGSFDDGVSPTSSRLCVACHEDSANQGFPMTNHVGAANHAGGVNYEGQDCIGCHPHSADGTRENLDGFMPVGGCTLCHATPQDNGDGVPVGGRRAVTPDFSRNSHHVQGAVSDADCVVCHEMTEHQQGFVRLRNVDTGTLQVSLTNPLVPAVLEPWCLTCHDADGAGGSAPFTDGIMPPVIDATLWAAASHEASAAVDTCWTCHDNGHGSEKLKLLAPWDATNDPTSPGDELRQEEGFCYTCHDADGPAGTNVLASFGQASHHDVNANEQIVNGSRVECANCHNPHQNNATSLLSNPDNTNQLWAGGYGDFCIACHDGVAPTGVTFPFTFLGTGYDKSQFTGSAHDTGLGARDCVHCHNDHGSTYDSILTNEYVTADPNPWQAADYQLCFDCHPQGRVFGTNAFGDKHSEHVRDDPGFACIHCHDVHYPYDAGEAGLINLVYGVDKLDITLNSGINQSTAYDNSINGGTENACYLSCHGKDHDGFTRDRTPIDTTNCAPCHAPDGP